ncbi:MAG TPA: hypothetical protein VKT21_02805 [Thermoplasmata archaeon]|nr:hypothetical protein [Thermoplasmata archaeon]
MLDAFQADEGTVGLRKEASRIMNDPRDSINRIVVGNENTEFQSEQGIRP